ncbi:MAG: type II secretion system F family protein [Pseudomonadota bacterium]
MFLKFAIFIGVVFICLAAFVGFQLLEMRQQRRERLLRKPKTSVSTKKQGRLKTVTDKVASQAASYYESTDPNRIKTLRLQLIQAGFFDPKAVGRYFALRLVLAVAGLGAAVAVLRFMMTDATLATQGMVYLSLTLLGYYLPSLYLTNRIKKVTSRNRLGFPDFMDLMVVCAEAGLSIEAALDRVGRELGPSYPELSTHLSVASLEMRAGHTMEESLRTLANRLGLEEVKSFATLLQQSKELGTSLSEALKVYSEEMKHKRLSAAEEKAYALPAKLSIPVTAFILPTVLLVAILPSIVRFMTGNF